MGRAEMTQEKRNTFLTSVPVPMLKAMVDDDKVSRDLKPSQELLEKIAEVKDSLTTAGQMIKEAYDLAIRDGFNPTEARQFLTAQLPFLAERTIRLALPEEAKNQTKVRHTMPQNKEPPPPNTVNITTKATIQDADLVKKDPPPPDDEDPKDLEIQFLKEKVTELEDALRKTEQFKPATQLQQITLTDPKGLIEKAVMNDEHYFKWLTDKADGIHSFYYDTYGIDLFRNRELSQLKNSGVKVFRRLYFEV